MRLVLVALAVIGCGGTKASSPAAAPPPPPPTPAATSAGDPAMVAELDAFFADPTREHAQGFMVRGIRDPDVTVVIPGDLLSLIGGPPIDEEATSLLLAGFIAGDLRAQYATGTKHDDFVAGLRGILTVARALGISTPPLDEAAARDAAGTLDRWAADWLAAHPSHP